jgi:uncharacterized HAD superfamily protein
MKVLPLAKNNKLTIAIDVDGTVADGKNFNFHKVDKNPNELLKVKPIKGALEAVRKLYREGHTIVFYTSRNRSSMKVTKQWLDLHGFPYHHIEPEKFVAHVYLDDRAIRMDSWKRVMKELKKPNLPGKIARRKGLV